MTNWGAQQWCSGSSNGACFPFTVGAMDRRNSEPYTEQSFTLQNQGYSIDILQKLNKLRWSGMFTDAIMCVGQEEFPVHRNVLAVSSPYFNAMFSSNLRESREAKISFTDISPRILQRIIDYAYCGCLEITQENAQELLAAGNLFEYPVIVESCCRFLRQQIHASNSLGIENLAHLHYCEELRIKAKKFTLDNFTLVVKCDEFLDLSKDRLMMLLCEDSIDVPNEEIVYEAAMNWIHFDCSSRQQYLHEILHLVRLPNINRSFLNGIKTDTIIQNSDDCLELVEDALRQQECGYEHGKPRLSKQVNKVHPRPSTIAKEVIVAVGGIVNNLTQSVEMYDIIKKKWMHLCDLPQAVSWYGVAAVNNCIILTGGMLDGYIVPHVWMYEPLKRSWSKIAPMLKPRAKHASVTLDGCVYIMGGVSYNTHIVDVDTIECFDPISNTWLVVGKCNLPRKQSRVIAFGESFAEIGGLQSDAKVNTVDCYVCSSSSSKWSIKSSGEQYILPEPIQFAQILVLNGVYYIIWEDSRKVLTLNPKRRMFRSLPDMKYVHIHSGATILDDKLYIMGGLVDSKLSKTVESYDPQTNKWTVETSMNQARAGHGCVVLFI